MKYHYRKGPQKILVDVINITFNIVALLGWATLLILLWDQIFNHGQLLINVLLRS